MYQKFRMDINFCMYGPEFDAYEFLIKAKNIPSDYSLWEYNEIMKNEDQGFTFHLHKNSNLASIPFSFGKFVLSNIDLLTDNKVVGNGIIKELSVVIQPINLKELNKKNQIVLYILNPKLLRLLADLKICLYITKAA